MQPVNKQEARGATTRQHLIEVATRLFGEHGYEATSIEAVLQEAGVSRGSLYYHFPGKEALFEAVSEAVEEQVGSRTAEAAAGADSPVAVLRAGCLAWVQMAGDPLVQRILLIDAPSVLGWERWRDMEERHALGLIKVILSSVRGRRGIPPDLVDMFAHVLLASVNEIALVVARSEDPGEAQRQGAAAVDELLGRLFGRR